MIEKEIFELTQDDLNKYPLWYFPMDDTVDNELTIRSLEGDCQPNDFQIIVRTSFVAQDGKGYIGYIYWSRPNSVEYIKPVVFVNNEDCVTCWNGMMEANWDDYGENQKELRSKFPLQYSSEAIQGLDTLSGELEGLYYLDGEKIIYIK